MDKVIQINPKEFSLQSSSGNTYTLKITSAGVRCNCTGYKFRGYCKHLSLIPIPVKKRYPREVANEVITILRKYLSKIKQFKIAGSYRRGLSTIGDVDILVETDSLEPITNKIRLNKKIKITVSGSDILRGNITTEFGEVQFDILRVNKKEWPTYLLYRTGPKKLNITMRSKAKKLNYKLNEHGLFDNKGNQIIVNNENDIFKAIGMIPLTPQERNNFNSK